MGRCLRRNISEGTAEFIAMEYFSWDVSVVDFFKKCFQSEESLAAQRAIARSLSVTLSSHPPCKTYAIRFTHRVSMNRAQQNQNGSLKKTLLRGVLVCAGSITILLPAWLPNRPGAPLQTGTVELLQVVLLAAATAVMIGALAHSGHRRSVCRVLAFGLAAALVGELEDFISGVLDWPFPDRWIIGALLLCALITIFRHRRVMFRFFGTMGHHAGAGFIAAALLILYVFNRVISTPQFWEASLGGPVSPQVPVICKTYLELLACYFILVGSIGLAITLGRREELK